MQLRLSSFFLFLLSWTQHQNRSRLTAASGRWHRFRPGAIVKGRRATITSDLAAAAAAADVNDDDDDEDDEEEGECCSMIALAT